MDGDDVHGVEVGISTVEWETDSDGVECDNCHKMTDTNNQEHPGVMTAPFIANDEQTPVTFSTCGACGQPSLRLTIAVT